MALKRWNIAEFDTVTAEGPHTKPLLTAADGAETILLSLLISNYSMAEDADIVVEHKDAADALLFKWMLRIAATSSPFALDSKLVVEPGDYITITSDIDAVSVMASGDES